MWTTVGIIIDVVIVLAIVICAILGFKKGFLKSVLSLFSWVICIVVAVFLAKYVAKWINGIYDFNGLIGGKISASLLKANETFFATSVNTFDSADSLIAGIPSGLNKFVAQLVKIVFKNTSVNYETETASIGTVVGTQVGGICMIVICGILVFAILKLVLFLLSKFVDKISQTKVIGTINKILGLVLGAVKACVVVIAVNCVIVLMTLIPVVNNTVKPIVQENTFVEKFIYNKTDSLVEKYVIDGKLIQVWIQDLWQSRK